MCGILKQWPSTVGKYCDILVPCLVIVLWHWPGTCFINLELISESIPALIQPKRMEKWITKIEGINLRIDLRIVFVIYLANMALLWPATTCIAFQCWFSQFLSAPFCWMRIEQVQRASAHGLGSKADPRWPFKFSNCALARWTHSIRIQR